MFKIVLAVDGSEVSDRAAAYLAKHRGHYGDAEIHLVNVQPSLPGTASGHLTREQRGKFHHEAGDAQLAAARRVLDAAGVKYEHHVCVGEPGAAIAAFCREHAIDQVVMGTRGRGSVAGAILGSVTHDVVEASTVPVLLVK
jgi:nucleotide-binding universal stress UspA family protein